MRDELREFESDASSRKTATDWLMQVISGKKPISFHLNGSEHPEGAEVEDGAVAVKEAPLGRMPLGRPPLKRVAREPMEREPQEREPQEAEQWRGEFTAEDLCGAPAVPVIKVAPAAKDEISAEDVCWVPEERRLKPQAAEAGEFFPAPKLQIVEAQGRERQVPPSEMEEGNQENWITAADISREVAPYMVEPIWAGPADGGSAGDADERVITAEDICRDWVIQEKEPPAIDPRDGVVLPFSYRVLKSASVGGESKAAAPETADAAAAETIASEAIAASEAPEAIATEALASEAVAVETIASGAVTAEAAEVEELAAAPGAGSEESAVASPESVAAVEARMDASEAAGVELVADMPVVEAEAAAVELVADTPAIEPEAVAESPAAGPEPSEIAEDRTWAEARAAEAEIELALHELEASGAVSGAQAAEAPGSVFAQEGFWEEAARAEGQARVEGAYEKPVVQEMKREMKSRHPGLEDLGELGQRPEGWISAWKTLLRLGSVLPWVAKALPMLESGGMAEPGMGGVGMGGAQEMRQDVSGLRLVQYEIRTTVQDHSLQLKRMEEQLGRVREALESRSSESEDLARSVRSMTQLVRLAGIGLGGLLAALIVLVGVMLAHGH